MAAEPGYVVWLTGVPGSGKTTLALSLAEALRVRRVERLEILDGDTLRSTPLCRGLGFSREDREENVRRIGFVAGLLARNGVVVIVSVISPYDASREEVRAGLHRFLLVHVDCPSEVAERRDPKGHYARARRGDIIAFTGVSDPYEVPAHPDLVVRTDRLSVNESVERVLECLMSSGHLSRTRA